MTAPQFTPVCVHGERARECRTCRPTDPALDDLLAEVEATLRRFVVLPDWAATLVAVWVAHVYAFDAFEFTPYLAVTSATKRSGKSRLLEAIELLLGDSRSVTTASISGPSLFRLIDGNPGMAVLFDELDRVPKEQAENLWGLINSGWRLGGKAHRQTGPRMDKLATFSTFSPKVLAGLGYLPDTVADRSIPIRMERRLPGEQVERLRLREATAEVADLRERLAEWADQDTIGRLRAARPAFPPGIANDRLMDVSEPLLAVADRAGETWPERVRAAVLALDEAAVDVEEEEAAVLALRHVYEAFTEDGVERMNTDDLLRRLVRRDDGPWAEWWGDKVEADKTVAPARRLSKLLGRFEDVKPKQLRTGTANARGYEAEPVRKAAERYLPHPSATPATSATPLTRPVAGVAGVADTPRGEAQR